MAKGTSLCIAESLPRQSVKLVHSEYSITALGGLPFEGSESIRNLEPRARRRVHSAL